MTTSTAKKSEEQLEEEESSSDQIVNRIKEFLDKVQQRLYEEERVKGDKTELSLGQSFDEDVPIPTDWEIYNKAMDEFVKQKQDQIAEEEGLEKEERIRRRKVSFDTDKSPQDILIQFGLALEHIYPDIMEEMESRNNSETVNPIMSKKEPTITRLIARNVGEYNNITIIYGGRGLLYNITDQLDMTQDERTFIKIAHEIAAKENNLHKYILRDEVLFIDQLLSSKIEN